MSTARGGFDFGPPIPPSAVPNDEVERLAWLRLVRSENVGPVTFLHLIRRFGDAPTALDALPELAERGGRRRIAVADAGRVEAEIASAQALGARPIHLGADDYPEALAAVEGPPPFLWARGEPSAAQAPAVAVVGARNASALGRRLAHALARDLAAAGVSVISGLARGIDAAAHKGALDAKRPAGVGAGAAVLAGGVDQIYPPENEPLYARLIEEGVALSEMPLGMTAQARHFPRRNRIVAGLGRGVIVVEAAERSGSLITARFAIEHGREAMATPGHPLDARANGCNALIRDGATLVRGVDDVLEAIADRIGGGVSAPRPRPLSRPVAPRPELKAAASPSVPDPTSNDALRETLFAQLGAAPIEVDALLRELGAEPDAVALALLELELAGRIERRPGDAVCRAPDAL